MRSVLSKKLFFTARVIVYCLKTIGLAPFSVTVGKSTPINSDDNPIRAFSFSKFGMAYNLLLLIPVTVAFRIHARNSISKNTLNKLNIVNMLSDILTTEKVLVTCASYIIIISWAFRQRSAACVMNRLLEVDICLSGLKKRPFNKRTLIFLALHIIINACLWITLWVGIITLFKHRNLLIDIFARLPEYIVYWYIMEYTTVVGLLLRDLETVNKYLLDVKEFGNHFSRPQSRNDHIIQAVIVLNQSCSTQIASLKLLRNVRTTLFELCGDIADFFSLPILFSVACCFITIFEKLYSMIRIVNVFPLALIAWMILVNLLNFVYPIISLAVNITRAKKETELTGQIVHKLLAVARTEEIKTELEQFSLQLLHEKVDFTAYGLFTLDSTLLQSMLAGAAGYAIILMQFGPSVCNCNCNCSYNYNYNDTSVD